MDSIVIHGGNRLNGQIEVSGAKNSAIKLMAASILTDQPLLLTNMPRLADTRFLGQLLQQFVSAGNALLVATSSFWEGVDVRGDALSLVIIDKLPFTSPDDPLLKARKEDCRT